ncbi:MAG: lytic transglycosylase domain-containing protein [Pseudomonadota bacterium]
MTFAATLAACVPGKLPQMPDFALPAMRWDHRPEAAGWTTSTLLAVAARDDVLANRVPGDIAAWCPAYPKAPLQDRRAFWVGLLSAVAKYESSWNPRASGGGGRYVGLMQISPATASQYDCGGGLKDGSANLACAVRIVAAQVGRDGVVAGRGNRGIGRDWGPFRSASKRAEMSAWTSKQSYCR